MLISTITVTSAAGAFEVGSDVPAGDTPSFVAEGDFNGDQKRDLAVTNPVVQPSATSPSTDIAAIEQSVLQQINAYRVSQGQPALTLNETISEQARIHSQHMASGTIAFGHTGFEIRIQTIAQTIPYRSISENVATNQGYSDPASTTVAGWLKSSGHLANIVGNYRLTGIGVAKNSAGQFYFTQILLN